MNAKVRYTRRIKAWIVTIEKYQQKINKYPDNKKLVKHYKSKIREKKIELDDFKEAIKKYEQSKIKPILCLQKTNKVKNIVCQFYGVLPEDIDSIDKGTAMECEAKQVYLYFIAVYFKGVPRKIMAEQIGRRRQSIDYGFNSTIKRKEVDRHFNKSLKAMSERVATVIGEEVKEANAKRPKIIQTGSEPVIENAIVRTAKEMPTILNPWLKSLSEKNIKGEVIKPVYF